MRRLSPIALIFCLLFLTPAASAQSSPPAGSDGTRTSNTAVWAVTPAFLQAAHQTCNNAGPSFAKCFIAQMSKNGAPSQAADFTQQLYKASGGEVGILSGFHAVGPVDVGWVVYPLRANTNNGLLFLNGQPPIVDAEDLRLLDQQTMKQSGQWNDLLGQFPQVSIWPGDRDGTTWPNSQKNGDGSVSFILGYPLRNGCHACASAGNALFQWNFDASGKFTGTMFLGMTSPPIPAANVPPGPLQPGAPGAPQNPNAPFAPNTPPQ